MQGADPLVQRAPVIAAADGLDDLDPARRAGQRVLELARIGATEREPIYTVRHRSRGPGEHQLRLDEEFCEFVQPLRANGA